jgi:hypothetical protein
VCRRDKERENLAAVQVLVDLLDELDAMPQRPRLLSLVQGVLAGNIFDWGAQACVALYHDGTILDIYRKAREDIRHRPWRVDHFDAFAAAAFAREREPMNTLGVALALLTTFAGFRSVSRNVFSWFVVRGLCAQAFTRCTDCAALATCWHWARSLLVVYEHLQSPTCLAEACA